MSDLPPEHDGSGSEIPANPLDEAVVYVEQAAHDLGLRPGDRMFVFYRTMMVLVHALVWSVKTNHEAHEQALEVLRGQQEAVLGNIQLQSTQFRAKLDEQAAEQRCQADRHFEELKRQKEELLARQSIADESKAFFDTLNSIFKSVVGDINASKERHIDGLYKITDDLNSTIHVAAEKFAKDLSASITYELRNSHPIVDAVNDKLAAKLSEVLFDAVENNFYKLLMAAGIVFVLGGAVDHFLLPVSSPSVQPGSVVHGLPPG